jgi:uncharacterized MAPEG superfamily protein
MLFWLLAALGLFFAQTMLPPAMRYLLPRPFEWARLWIALGPRDQQPPLSVWGGRAERALANLREAMPVFLPLAVVHVVEPAAEGGPEVGAAIFVIARMLYVPAYLSGIPGLRSTLWLVSCSGLAWMIAPLAMRT